MRSFSLIFTAFIFACSPCVNAWPEEMIVVRHAHKAPVAKNPELSLCGKSQAKAMAKLIPLNLQHAWHSGYLRTEQTAKAMAPNARLHHYKADDFSSLLASLSTQSTAALIVGHSNTVPLILALLSEQAPPELSEENYGQVFWLKKHLSKEQALVDLKLTKNYEWSMLKIARSKECS